MHDLIEAKKAARAAALARRAGCEPALGQRLAGQVLAHAAPPAGAVVSGFWPIGEEIDIRPLLLALAGRGHPVVLPVTTPRGQPLVFRRWHFGEPLHKGRFGTVHPDGPAMQPDFLLVPLLAFDRAGRRLGYGGGYYDRTIAALPRARTLGVAYAAQELDAVPVADYDARLQAVATERGILLTG